MARRARKITKPEERRFLEQTFPVALASVLMRYDGRLAESSTGVAHVAADITEDALREFKKRGWL